MTQPFVDAFGQLFWDAYHHGYPYQLIERSDGLMEAAPAQVYFTEYPDWAPEEQQAVGMAGGRVLDIGCGAGRHALYLQDAGLDVVGIDSSPLAVRVCSERGLKQAHVLSITGLRKLAMPPFDTVLMLGNNLGLLGNPTRARWILNVLYATTRDSALVIGQDLDPYQTDDPLHLAYHRRNRERGRMGGQVRIRVRHRNLIGPWFDYLFLSRSELADLVSGTGWRIARVVGEGRHYVAILEKTDVVSGAPIARNPTRNPQ